LSNVMAVGGQRGVGARPADQDGRHLQLLEHRDAGVLRPQVREHHAVDAALGPAQPHGVDGGAVVFLEAPSPGMRAGQLKRLRQPVRSKLRS
jgi:hypothetical protein